MCIDHNTFSAVGDFKLIVQQLCLPFWEDVIYENGDYECECVCACMRTVKTI